MRTMTTSSAFKLKSGFSTDVSDRSDSLDLRMNRLQTSSEANCPFQTHLHFNTVNTVWLFNVFSYNGSLDIIQNMLYFIQISASTDGLGLVNRTRWLEKGRE